MTASTQLKRETGTGRGSLSFLHKFLDAYHDHIGFFDRLVSLIAGALFITGVGATLLGAVGRKFPELLPNVTWSAEVTTLAIITAVLLVVARGLRENTHMAVTMLPERLSDRGFQVLTFVIQLLVIAFFWVVVRYGLDVMDLNRSQSTPILGLSLWWPYLVVVATGALMLLESVVRLLEAALGRAPRPQVNGDLLGVE